ncbi:MAG: hypothetical protein KGI58_00265 [Patescibacteria group bacterium]|nr:hypothetical protein [Patescibacteria group bacterium]
MDYNHISNFLDKFKKTLFKNEEYNNIISTTITHHISLSIDPRTIKTKGTIIYIKGSPILKSEILIHKNNIINDLSKIILDRKFTDIR